MSIQSNIEKVALDAGLDPREAKEVSTSAVKALVAHRQLLVAKSLVAHLTVAKALVAKAGKPVGTISQRKDGKWKKVGEGQWEKVLGDSKPESDHQDEKGVGTKNITQDQAREYRSKGVVPDGWFVHGRSGRQDLDTGNVIQLSNDWDVAEQYAGKNGSQWMLAPKDPKSVMDLTDESIRDDVEEKLRGDYESGKLSSSTSFSGVGELIETRGADEDSVNDMISGLVESLNPENIVDSAGWHDNQDLVYWLNERFGPGMVQTNDGAVVYDLSKMQQVKL